MRAHMMPWTPILPVRRREGIAGGELAVVAEVIDVAERVVDARERSGDAAVVAGEEHSEARRRVGVVQPHEQADVGPPGGIPGEQRRLGKALLEVIENDFGLGQTTAPSTSTGILPIGVSAASGASPFSPGATAARSMPLKRAA
ncbi:MAG TPA: hypothetical protein VEB19_05800, partial [Gemmatimonadaceae bacterium]|nr:hypothetical protein [Gemmatimonadaceae bacterium]